MSFVETSFTDSASMVAHYRAVRQRLYGKPRTVVQKAGQDEVPPQPKARFIYFTPVTIEREPEKLPEHIAGPVPRGQLPVRAKKRDYLWVSTPLQAGEQENPFRWKEIVAEVCSKHAVSYAEAMSDRRWKPIVSCRAEIYYRLYKETTLSLPQIGQKLGGKDHTTVMYGIRRHMRDNGIAA